MALATRIPVPLIPLAFSLCACGGSPAKASAVRAPPAAPVDAARPEPSLAPATPEEIDVAGRLRATVTRLSVGIGPRDGRSVWNLATAADELVLLLEGKGHAVRRQGFDVGDAVAQNLEVSVPGAAPGGEVVVVGAHYDTAPGSPGANDNASGVAALVELLGAFQGERPGRTLRFALFSHEEEPYFRTDRMGSLVYAKALAAEGARVAAMISLDSLGFYDTRPGSQRYPAELASGRPSVGDFVAIVGNEASRSLVDQATREMKLHASLPVVGEVFASEAPGAGASDHWAFWQIGAPAILVTDTATFRDPEHGQPGDLPARLDFDRMARVVVGLRKTIGALAGTPAPSAVAPASPEAG